MVAIAELGRSRQLRSLGKVAAFLGVKEAEVDRLLEEGRLEGAILATLRRRGVAVTPNLKNSVQKLVRTISPDRAALGSQLNTGASLNSDTTATIMFTDIVGSSAMMERLGDRGGRLVLSAHEEIIRSNTAAHNGTEVKSLGDGFMLIFPSVRRGVQCAIAVQKALIEHNRNQTEARILVRIGLSVGEPIREDEDMYGTSVIRASRIASMAKGGQVLVCHIAYTLASTSGDFEFRPVGVTQLKGIEGKHPLFEVVWERDSGTEYESGPVR